MSKMQENFLSVFILDEAKEVKPDGTEEFSVERTLHDRGSYYNLFFICLQAVNTHRIHLLARMLVPRQDFPFLASWGMVIKNICRSKRCKAEHNTNSADKIFYVKEIPGQ